MMVDSAMQERIRKLYQFVHDDYMKTMKPIYDRLHKQEIDWAAICEKGKEEAIAAMEKAFDHNIDFTMPIKVNGCEVFIQGIGAVKVRK